MNSLIRSPFSSQRGQYRLFDKAVIYLKQEQLLPISIEEAWKFFSDPANLNTITPDDMVFEITSEIPPIMYEGMIITYRIKPVLNIPVKWCTEITHIKEGSLFIDEQRTGPYRFWHHEHHFREVPGGIIMTDLLHYDIGKSFIGWIAGKLFIHRRVRQIFEYRYKILEQLFRK
jgi:ligand-binding SRPBCC domain-containing protein